MRRRTLTELADNPDLISGIYNYCDRWCERCPFTSRCLVYATEQLDEDHSPESRDVRNEAFWRKLSLIFEETQDMVEEWAKEAGVDLNDLPEEDPVQVKRKRTRVDNHSLTKAGKQYASAVSDWFRDFDQIIEVSDQEVTGDDDVEREQLQDAREIIHWYQYQIAVKTMRALSGKDDELDFEDEEIPKDSNGSAKVALIGIDRSVVAWRLIQLSVPERADLIVPLIVRLERLRQRLEKEFPDARDFIRPGFDEVVGALN